MSPSLFALPLLSLAGACVAPVLTLSGEPTENLYRVDPSNDTVTVMGPTFSSLWRMTVGLAPSSSHSTIYARVSPNDEIGVLDSGTGAWLSDFSPGGVSGDCGQLVLFEGEVQRHPILHRPDPLAPYEFVDPEGELLAFQCGLAYDRDTKTLFLDDPAPTFAPGVPPTLHIVQVEPGTGTVVASLLVSPATEGWVTGLAFDNLTKLLWVLLGTEGRLLAVDASGLVVHDVELQEPGANLPPLVEGRYTASSLAVDSLRSVLYIGATGGDEVWVYDLNGRFVEAIQLGRSFSPTLAGAEY